jgi:hypothetical protein
VSTIALITWVATALFGLFMFAIWLIEYGGRDSGQPPSRLPSAVICGHVLLAGAGLSLWLVYLVADDDVIADIVLGLLVSAAALGFVMFSRWVSVYRQTTAPRKTADSALSFSPAPVSLDAAAPPVHLLERPAIPAEGNFPVGVVLGHGLFAGATIVLVLLTVLRG